MSIPFRTTVKRIPTQQTKGKILNLLQQLLLLFVIAMTSCKAQGNSVGNTLPPQAAIAAQQNKNNNGNNGNGNNGNQGRPSWADGPIQPQASSPHTQFPTTSLMNFPQKPFGIPSSPAPTLASTRNVGDGDDKALLPSSVPTPSLTNAPSPGTTLTLSMLSTTASTNEPTNQPTILSTLLPTLNPTNEPSTNPTTLPSDEPSSLPTKVATMSPTQMVSAFPTGIPSLIPTQVPTAKPTILDSDSPSSLPTHLASQLPTITSSKRPSVSPSSLPTSNPSSFPTSLPSLLPSLSPSVKTSIPSISVRPSIALSNLPTGQPSSEPSRDPSDLPSKLPSTVPTSVPSYMPSLSLQTQLVPGTIVLSASTYLRGLSIINWETVTATHIRLSILEQNIEPPLTDLRVAVNLLTQGFQNGSEEKAPSGRFDSEPTSTPSAMGGGRFLQQTLQQVEPLEITFDTLVSFRSSSNGNNIAELISMAFDSEEEIDIYISRLSQTGDSAFKSVVEVRLLEVNGVNLPTEPEEKEQDTTMWIIIGAVAGGGALFSLVLIILLRSRMKVGKGTQPESAETMAGTSKLGGLSTEILVEGNQDDISTLGDPMFTQNGMHIVGMEKDEATASVGDGYDYAKQYRYLQQEHPGSVAASQAQTSRFTAEELTRASSGNSATLSKIGIGQMGETFFSDDASFEEQYAEPEETFDVIVPAGKLGMVIDTPSGGVPIVHAIKDTSVLAHRVRVGDRLVSVDGEDCTSMTAVQVSKLISIKSDQPSRTLVFIRNRSTASNPL